MPTRRSDMGEKRPAKSSPTVHPAKNSGMGRRCMKQNRKDWTTQAVSSDRGSATRHAQAQAGCW